MDVRKVILLRGLNMLLKLGWWNRVSIRIGPKRDIPFHVEQILSITIKLKNIKLMVSELCPDRIVKPFSIS